MKRAYSIVQNIKAMEEGDERVIRGMATTPSVDRMGDIVEPMGVQVAGDIPLFLYHDSGQTVGRAKLGKATKDGIPFEARLPLVKEMGRLRDRVDEAWQMLKYRLITGVSIGFNVIEDAYELMKDGGIRFLKTEVLELSLVPIPANSEALITTVKSICEGHRAALGPPRDPHDSPGASGQRSGAPSGALSLSRSQKGITVKTITQLREERTQKAARMKELVELMQADDHDTTDEESSEFDELKAEVKSLDTEIRVAEFNAIHVATAKPVEGAKHGFDAGSRVRGGLSFVKKEDPDDKFEGQSFIRQLKLKAMSRLTHESVASLAEVRFGKSHPRFVQAVKAAVAGGGTGSGEWGAELLSLNAQYEGDFIQYLYSMTVFDKLNLPEVPANVRIKGQDGAASANWVGQSKGIPLSTLDTSTIDLVPLKVAALCVMSNELIMDSSPAADRLARNALVEASSQKVDGTFFSTTAASSGVSPAGMLNGLSALSPSGTDEAAVRADIQALLYPFVTAKMASGIVLCMNPAQGLALGSMFNAFSMPAFPGLNENGGTFGGRRVHCGDNITAGQVIAIREQDVWKIGDGGVQVSMSDVATIEMNDAPAGASDTPTAMASHAVSMFQTESTAFKVVRRINFQKRRSNAVVYMDNVEWGGVTS